MVPLRACDMRCVEASRMLLWVQMDWFKCPLMQSEEVGDGFQRAVVTFVDGSGVTGTGTGGRVPCL